MIFLGKWQNKDFSFSFKSNSLTISLSGSTGADVFSWDRAGRLWTGMEQGKSYRRGLNGKIVAKWQTTPHEKPNNWLDRLGFSRYGDREKIMPGRSRRWLDVEEGLSLEERARLRLLALVSAIEDGNAVLQAKLPDEAKDFFQIILGFDRERSIADAEYYQRVYKPVGILPPDQYFSVVLQATEGCSFNTCTYCTFYRDRPFRVKSPEQFQAHIKDVKNFIGAGMSLRRTIFLGDANALTAPIKRLVELFKITNSEFDVNEMGGIFAFLDGFSGDRKKKEDFEELRALGLSRVYIGMESGNASLLKFLKKPGEPEDVLHAVTALKSAGISVGLIVLLGAGGHSYARQHIADTIQLLNAMPLDAEDLIYFSELIEDEGMDYTRDAHAARLRPLTSFERITQGDRIEQGLKFSLQGGTPHISRYDIREFVY